MDIDQIFWSLFYCRFLSRHSVCWFWCFIDSCGCICVFFFFFNTELPSLLPIVDVAEALLHVRNGEWFLCLLVANVPDSFNEGTICHCFFSDPPLKTSVERAVIYRTYVMLEWGKYSLKKFTFPLSS